MSVTYGSLNGKSSRLLINIEDQHSNPVVRLVVWSKDKSAGKRRPLLSYNVDGLFINSFRSVMAAVINAGAPGTRENFTMSKYDYNSKAYKDILNVIMGINEKNKYFIEVSSPNMEAQHYIFYGSNAKLSISTDERLASENELKTFIYNVETAFANRGMATLNSVGVKPYTYNGNGGGNNNNSNNNGGGNSSEPQW